MRSIAWMILAIIVLTSFVVSGSTVLITAVSFWNDLERAQLEQLEEYVVERGRLDAALFDRMATSHREAMTALDARMPNMSDDWIEAEFDRLFPEREDGTRRGTDTMFEGYTASDGDWHFGTAAFLNSGEEWTLAQKRLLVASYIVVDGFGQALQSQLDNLYFYSPDNALVIFAPHREDRLVFYRHTAPPDFDLRDASFHDLVLPENNPAGEFVCDELSQLVYVQEGEALTTGCFSPYRRNGQHIGAFGTTVELRNYFTEAMSNPPSYGENLIIDRRGNLIAHAELLQSVVTEEAVAAVSERFDTQSLLQAIQASGAEFQTGVTLSSDGQWVIGFSWLEGPDWYAISRLDREVLRRDLAGQVLMVVVIGVLGLILQSVLAYYILFRRLVRPISSLARHFGALRPLPAATNPVLEEALKERNELGLLAQRLESQRVRNERTLDELEDRVAERTQELEIANQAKSDFLANMSHEIRTPLNGILGLAQVIQMKARSREVQEQARMIHESGETLTGLLNDILDMSKIEAGKLDLAPTATDIRADLQDLRGLLKGSADAKGLYLEFEIAEDVPQTMIVDALRVRQCVTNLLSNAIKFTRSGGVRLVARCAESERCETGHTGIMEISVSDTGMGIEPRDLERLFSPFTQASADVARTHGGTGLGLAITRSLAEMMGGSVTARSIPGEGSTFTLRFQGTCLDEISPEVPVSNPAALADAPEFAPLRDKRLLLVEDNFINRQVASAFLAPLGGELDMAENGEEALQRLRDADFDLILMDVRMPVKDGLETTREIRAMETGLADIAIVALTANAADADARACREAGMDAYASKPLAPATLYQAMLEAWQAAQSRKA
nr:ATP-binding protein [Maricaulis parjimensis]